MTAKIFDMKLWFIANYDDVKIFGFAVLGINLWLAEDGDFHKKSSSMFIQICLFEGTKFV